MTFTEDARALVRELTELDAQRFSFAPPCDRTGLPSDWPEVVVDFYSSVTAGGPGFAVPRAIEGGGERLIFVADYGCGSFGASWATGPRRGEVSFFDGSDVAVDDRSVPFEAWALGVLRGARARWVEARVRALVEGELEPTERDLRAIDAVASEPTFALGDGPACVAMLRGDFVAAERRVDARHGSAKDASGVARHRYWRALVRRRQGRLDAAREETELGLAAYAIGDVGADLRRLRDRPR